MKILMLHPHDINSALEPWTVRITSIAGEFIKKGHLVKLVYFPLEKKNAYKTIFVDGIETISLNRRTGIWVLFQNLKYIIKLAEWCDIVHFQKCFYYAALPALIAAWIKNKPVHYDWDDWETVIFYRSNPRWLSAILVKEFINLYEKLIPKIADTVSVASEHLRHLCLGSGVLAEDIFKAPVGADLKLFKPNLNHKNSIKRQYNINKYLILYVGQLNAGQYAELLIKAARKIIKKGFGVTFMIVGTGYKLKGLIELAIKLNVQGHFIFTGPIAHNKIPYYIAEADVCVACFEDHDIVVSKSPLKVVEYLSCGKAVVASDVAEVRNMVKDAGILTEAGNVDSLAEGIMTLLKNAKLRKELGKRARERAKTIYNWPQTAQTLLKAYKRANEKISVAKRAEKEYNWSQAAKDLLKICKKISALIDIKTRLKKLKRQRRNGLVLAGIFDGIRAFAGPYRVQIDLTNSCNNNCIACWCRSPLLEEKKQDTKEILEYSVALDLINQLYQMDIEQIDLSGGGEPFKHPRIMDIISYIKKKSMICSINTNFTLLDEGILKQLCCLGLDYLTVSLWSATARTYAATHPNKTEETFIQIKQRLKLLAQLKQNGKPHVQLYNVIFNLNYREINKMINFARDVKADEVGFAFADTIPGKTDCLLLNSKERSWLVKCCEKINDKLAPDLSYNGLSLSGFDHFLRRAKSPSYKDAEYDKEIVPVIPCYTGWIFARVLANGNVNSCLKSHRFPIGNVYKESFSKIWNSKRQKIFRARTKVYKKDDPIFNLIGNNPDAEIGCYKSCDDLLRNIEMHKKMNELTLKKEAMAHILRLWVIIFNFLGARLRINKKIIYFCRRMLKFPHLLYLLFLKLAIDIYVFIRLRLSTRKQL